MSKIILVEQASEGWTGKAVGWRPQAPVRYGEFIRAATIAGVELEHLPSMTTEDVAFSRACKRLAGGRSKRIIRMRDGGICLKIHEDVLASDHRSDVEAHTELRVWLIKGEIVAEPSDHPLVGTLERHFNEYRMTLRSGDVSAWLIARLQALHATPILSMGDYFVPPSAVPEWERMHKAIKSVGALWIGSLNAVSTDRDAVETILTGLRAEAENACSSWDALAQGEDVSRIGQEKERIKALREKVSAYETLLNTNLEELRERLTQTEAVLTKARISSLAQKRKAQKGVK